MERLTYWNEEHGCWSYRCASGDAAKRLAAYEDSGLTPERVQELAIAEREGRLIIKQCNEGSAVWKIKDGVIVDGVVINVVISNKRPDRAAIQIQWLNALDFVVVRNDEIGKSIFIVYADAKAALAQEEARNE